MPLNYFPLYAEYTYVYVDIFFPLPFLFLDQDTCATRKNNGSASLDRHYSRRWIFSYPTIRKWRKYLSKKLLELCENRYSWNLWTMIKYRERFKQKFKLYEIDVLKLSSLFLILSIESNRRLSENVFKSRWNSRLIDSFDGITVILFEKRSSIKYRKKFNPQILSSVKFSFR